MGQVLEERRSKAAKRLDCLRSELQTTEELVHDKACVYVTGSFGRTEASSHSDLDLFIVGQTKGGQRERALTNLDEILVKADLIRAADRLKFPRFSGDGEYLEHYTVDSLVHTLGKPEDDATNTFTARLLLLLESRPLLGADMYPTIIRTVIDAYWRDYHDHSDCFVPAFLTNDILRLWRTFCVNYEASTVVEPPVKKAKRRIKNYKLKHSRLLTCYSGLAYLLTVFSESKPQGTVRPEDVEAMVQLTPSERIEWLSKRNTLVDQRKRLETILELYEDFLKQTDAPEEELLARFQDAGQRRQYDEQTVSIGREMHLLLSAIGKGNELHRLLLV